jgi:glycosyltransferase involved in cell wall biosynthesis
MPKVSIAVPTYNRSSLVNEAVNSILLQTEKDLEIVLVDDGSTDNTSEVIEKINDDRIKYYYKENGGCASARNMGLRKSTGRYIAFLDSDDLWPKDFLSTMLKNLESQPEYGCAYCSVVKVFPDGQKKTSYGANDCKSGWITKDLYKRSFIWIQAALFRSEALANLKFDEPMRNAADTDALLRLSTKIQFLFVPDIQVTFRTEHGIAPRKDMSSINCNRIRVLERFYYRLGGDKFVPPNVARRKLSHAYRGIARNYYNQQYRSAAIMLYKKAISYLPFDIRLYIGLFKTFLLNKDNDGSPNWKMPSPLPDIEM